MQKNMPITIIIFGASGDLTQRKLIPALYSSYKKGNLPEKFNVVGFARRDWSHEYFREHLLRGLNEFAADIFEDGLWESFKRKLWYFKGNLDNTLDFENLRAYLNDLEDGHTNRLYYLATAPRFFVPIVKSLGQAGLAREGKNAWRHVVVEKPFGHDLKSAQELNEAIHGVFKEHQIYRIDHYLGQRNGAKYFILSLCQYDF